MNFQQVTNSRLGVGMALGLGKALPQRIGYPMARWIADRISGRRQLEMVQAVKANQWVVSGGQLSPIQLDEMARRVLRNVAACQYDLYHNLNNEKEIFDRVEISPELITEIRQIIGRKAGGQIIVAPHLSNFDLMARAIAIKGISFQAISPPDPNGGYQMQNRFRENAGIEVTPISTSTLRKATERLQQGGIVLTGVDRPTASEKYRPRFFGRPASLPVIHIRLAIKTGVPIRVVACQMKPGGKYRLLASDPIYMQPDTDIVSETERNAEAILAVAEKWIMEFPEQWSMTYPVWPEILKEMRGRL